MVVVTENIQRYVPRPYWAVLAWIGALNALVRGISADHVAVMMASDPAFMGDRFKPTA